MTPNDALPSGIDSRLTQFAVLNSVRDQKSKNSPLFYVLAIFLKVKDLEQNTNSTFLWISQFFWLGQVRETLQKLSGVKCVHFRRCISWIFEDLVNI